MKRVLSASLLAIGLMVAGPASAQTATGSPLIDYDGYSSLTSQVRDYRAQRLVSVKDFNERKAKADILVLDARSAQAFAEGHIDGAVNLPLPDFTENALAQAIGANKDREILIYCNNNFTDNRRPVVTKSLQLALNIQTFINLYGYGYKNVYELGEALKTTDSAAHWVAAPAALRQFP